MPLSDLIKVTINLSGPTPSVPGFGIPLLLAYHTKTPDLVNYYASLDEVEGAGFSSVDAVWQMAAAAFSQNPAPQQVVVGRRTRAYTRSLVFTPLNLTEGYVYAFTITDTAGVDTDVTYPVANGDDASDIVTGLKASIGSPAGVTKGGTTTLTLAATVAGTMFDVSKLPGPSVMSISDVTANPGSGGVAADFAAVLAADSETWYGVHLDSSSKAEIEALAVPVETARKLLVGTTSDTACTTSATTDVMSELQALSYFRTGVFYSANRIQSYLGLRTMARRLATNPPGSSPWTDMTLVGAAPDGLTSAQSHEISGIATAGTSGKNGTSYELQNKIPITKGGRVAGGEWFDVVHGIDWLYANLQVACFAVKVRLAQLNSKAPYTNDGIGLFVSAIQGVLNLAVANNFLAASPAPTVTAPDVSTISASDKHNRRLPGIKFTGTLAGAIVAVDVTGTVTE